MCHNSLAARGVNKIRSVGREDVTKPAVPLRDEEAIARKKANRLKEARRRKAKAARERRKQAKKEKEGLKNLRQQGLIH